MNYLVGQVMDGFISLDPLLGQLPRSTSIHHGPIRNVRGATPLDQSSMEVEISAGLTTDAVRNTDIEEHTAFLAHLAEANISSIAPQFFKGLEEVTNATGNAVDAGGKPFSWDYYNDVIEKMPLEFADDGKPHLPTLVMHPNLFEKIKEIEPTPEQLARRSRILERKRAEFNAQKRTRRLS